MHHFSSFPHVQVTYSSICAENCSNTELKEARLPSVSCCNPPWVYWGTTFMHGWTVPPHPLSFWKDHWSIVSWNIERYLAVPTLFDKIPWICLHHYSQSVWLVHENTVESHQCIFWEEGISFLLWSVVVRNWYRNLLGPNMPQPRQSFCW